MPAKFLQLLPRAEHDIILLMWNLHSVVALQISRKSVQERSSICSARRLTLELQSFTAWNGGNEVSHVACPTMPATNEFVCISVLYRCCKCVADTSREIAGNRARSRFTATLQLVLHSCTPRTELCFNNACVSDPPVQLIERFSRYRGRAGERP